MDAYWTEERRREMSKRSRKDWAAKNSKVRKAVRAARKRKWKDPKYRAMMMEVLAANREVQIRAAEEERKRKAKRKP